MKNIKPVKTAVIGCGMISNIYIRNLKDLFHIIDLTAVCDIRLESAQEKAAAYGIETVMTMEEVAASDEIELVVNLTGPGAHYSVIRQMLEAGKHVFTEKTLAVTFKEGKELVRLADERGLYLGAAPDTVLGAGLQTARKAIDAGLIGKVTSCFASINRNHPLLSEAFRFIQNGPGGAFSMDVGVYYVAALLSLLGPVDSVSGFSAPAPVHEKEFLFMDNKESWQLEGSNLMTAALRFRNGVLGMLHFNGLSINKEMPMIYIYGTEGILQIGDPNTFCGEVKLIREIGEPCLLPFTHGYDGSVILDNPTAYEQSYGHRGVGAAEMAWAMRLGRQSRCSKEFALHTLELISGIDHASREGKTCGMTTDFTFRPLKTGYNSRTFGGVMRADAERSLME